MWSLLEECLARFLRSPVRGRSSISLLVSNRSSRTGSILSCSSTTPLRTHAHLERRRDHTGVTKHQRKEGARLAWAGTYPRLSCRDVLQRPDGSLPTRGVAVAALEDELVQRHRLRVPEPVRPLGLARHLGQDGEVLVALPWGGQEVRSW